MLLGEYEHTIDDKSRLTLPARFRQAFTEGVVVSRGLDGCLYAYPRADWTRAIEARLAELDPLSKEGRRLQRYFYSGARGRARQAGPDRDSRCVAGARAARPRRRRRGRPRPPRDLGPRRLAARARRGRRECGACCRTSCSQARLITSPSSRARFARALPCARERRW